MKLVERIVNCPVKVHKNYPWNNYVKLIAIGSMLSFAKDDDVIWGSGINGKLLDTKHYKFSRLDIRAVRGPLTRNYLRENFQVKAPEVYGDPGLLIPYYFLNLNVKRTQVLPILSFLIIVKISSSLKMCIRM